MNIPGIPPPPMKIVCLVRHAKASRDDPSLRDFDRPLNTRGKKQAPWLGRRLEGSNVHPGVIISSPAKRAIATAETLAGGIQYPLEKIITEPALYESGASAILGVIKGIARNHERAVVVGHNPALSDLMSYLSCRELDELPAGGIVCLKFDVDSWEKIARGKGEILFYDAPPREEE